MAVFIKTDKINVTGYRLGISYICTALRYKPAFFSNMVECSPSDQKGPGLILGRVMEIFFSVRDKWRPVLITQKFIRTP